MDFDSREQAFLDRWQHLQIKIKTETAAASKCDVLRSLITQLEYGRAANMIDADTAAPLLSQFTRNYSCVVDVPEEEGGVDNYAENALALTAGKKSESKVWSSSLNREKLMQLDCVKAYIQDSKLARAMHFPEDRDSDILFPHEIAPPGSSEPTCTNKSVTVKANAQPLFKNHAQDSQLARGTLDRSKQSEDPKSRSDRPTSSLGAAFTPNHMDSSSGFNSKGDDQHRMNNSSSTKWQWGRPDPAHTSPNPGQLQSSRVAPKPPTLFTSDKAGSSHRKPVKRPCRELDDNTEEEDPAPVVRAFRTAGEQLAINNQKKYGGGRSAGAGGQNNVGGSVSTAAYGTQKRSLGTRRGLNSKFIPPVIKDENGDGGSGGVWRKSEANKGDCSSEEPVDERLKNIEPKMVELINSEIMDHGPEIAWTDIAGLEFAKKTIKEIVVWPMLRPDIFTGLRGPPKGLLLFGPPGTGKTLIGKCIASQSKSTFFSISASSLTSKWVGEGEKMVRALFAVARVHQPSVIFIDEIDSLLSQRSDGENEGSRRIKTEFLVQLDGATTQSDERILVVGATNRPQEIDEAARRRFVKRLYIPLPELTARRQIVVNLMGTQNNQIEDNEIDKISGDTDGYSGADMANLCREAALGPIRSVPFEEIENIAADQVRPIIYQDFEEAIEHVRPSVSEKDLYAYLDWNKQYGSWSK